MFGLDDGLSRRHPIRIIFRWRIGMLLCFVLDTGSGSGLLECDSAVEFDPFSDVVKRPVHLEPLLVQRLVGPEFIRGAASGGPGIAPRLRVVAPLDERGVNDAAELKRSFHGRDDVALGDKGGQLRGRAHLLWLLDVRAIGGDQRWDRLCAARSRPDERQRRTRRVIYDVLDTLEAETNELVQVLLREDADSLRIAST